MKFSMSISIHIFFNSNIQMGGACILGNDSKKFEITNVILSISFCYKVEVFLFSKTNFMSIYFFKSSCINLVFCEFPAKI